MEANEPIYAVEASAPVMIQIERGTLRIWLEEARAIEAEITRIDDSYIDVDGNRQTVYGWKKIQPVPSGKWQDSDDKVKGHTADHGVGEPDYWPAFPLRRDRPVRIGDRVRLYPGTQDTRPDETVNTGLDWYFFPPFPTGTILKVAPLNTPSSEFGIAAIVQAWDDAQKKFVNRGQVDGTNYDPYVFVRPANTGDQFLPNEFVEVAMYVGRFNVGQNYFYSDCYEAAPGHGRISVQGTQLGGYIYDPYLGVYPVWQLLFDFFHIRPYNYGKAEIIPFAASVANPGYVTAEGGGDPVIGYNFTYQWFTGHKVFGGYSTPGISVLQYIDFISDANPPNPATDTSIGSVLSGAGHWRILAGGSGISMGPLYSGGSSLQFPFLTGTFSRNANGGTATAQWGDFSDYQYFTQWNLAANNVFITRGNPGLYPCDMRVGGGIWVSGPITGPPQFAPGVNPGGEPNPTGGAQGALVSPFAAGSWGSWLTGPARTGTNSRGGIVIREHPAHLGYSQTVIFGNYVSISGSLETRIDPGSGTNGVSLGSGPSGSGGSIQFSIGHF